ncbi:EexN family lipoprotein [Brucella anthropi]|uniref:EexN family lipoprotein n=1 Tax=Brucella TaxID=234 RepID=UPI00194F17C7|nr:EexN family lipoprotein [Brucella anthropi]MBM6397136.1 EexN family lipoprotein [Brucella anthropi]
MKRLVSIAVLVCATGCSEERNPTLPVEVLMADETLLNRILAECRNDPGQLRGTPGCVNAEAADGKRRLRQDARNVGELMRCIRCSTSSTGSSNNHWKRLFRMEH